MSERKIPEGRLGRLARLAAAGARSGAGMLLSRSSEGSAEKVADVLGTLRGLAAKVGQMASYVDGLIPEDHKGAYEGAMKRLRDAAPTSSPTEIHARVEEELGAKMEELFAEWEKEPFASASIGQVHRAKMHDGRAVAVKVQHPGITKALESDLKNAGILETMIGTIGGARRFNSKEMLEVARKRFREELDYSLEAERQEFFRKVHQGDPTIRIPAIIAERSTKRVMTSDLATGASFEEACTRSEADREAWARTMWRCVFKGNLIGGKFNADPHPGNYFFHDDGVVTFVDYGCVQEILEQNRKNARTMHIAAMEKDEETFRTSVRGLIGTHPGKHEDLMIGFVRACFEPLFNRPFRFTRPYASSLVASIKEVAVESRKLADRDVQPVSPEFLFLNRMQFGFYSVLARLDVSVDYAAVEQEFLL